MRGRRIAAGTEAVRFQPPPPTATAQVKKKGSHQIIRHTL